MIVPGAPSRVCIAVAHMCLPLLQVGTRMTLVISLLFCFLAGRTSDGFTATATAYPSKLVSSSDHPTNAAGKASRAVSLVGNPVELYNVRVQVGNQHFQVILDSGSSNLILPGEHCFGCGPVPTSYKPSPRSKDLRIYDFVKYGLAPYLTGAYGDFYLDEVEVGGVDPVSVVVMSVAASGLQGYKSTIRAGEPMQGILGVGPENVGFLNNHGIGRLGNDSYLVALGKLPDTPSILAVQLCSTDGYMWLGYPNPRHFEGDPEYTPVEASPYVVRMSISFGSQQKLNISHTLALVDTGTNFLLLPESGYSDFMMAVDPNNDMFDTDQCLTKRSLGPADAEWQFPDMTISFVRNLTDVTTGRPFSIPAHNSYMVPSLQADGSTLWCHRVSCCSDIMILGAPMMRHFVMLFDMNNQTGPRVGFAPQQVGTCPTHPIPPSPSPAPGPSSGQQKGRKMSWWEVTLWTMVGLAMVAFAAVLAILEYQHIGPSAWVSKALNSRDARGGDVQQNELTRPIM